MILFWVPPLRQTFDETVSASLSSNGPSEVALFVSPEAARRAFRITHSRDCFFSTAVMSVDYWDVVESILELDL